MGFGGDDRLYGGSSSDVLIGHVGNDLLYGGSGEDNLFGGAGDDYLVGNQGNDLYHWGRGDGNDRISDADGMGNYAGDQNGVVLGAGIIESDLSFSRNNDSLVFTLNDTGETLTIVDHFMAAQIHTVTLADDTALDIVQVENGLFL